MSPLLEAIGKFTVVFLTVILVILDCVLFTVYADVVLRSVAEVYWEIVCWIYNLSLPVIVWLIYYNF